MENYPKLDSKEKWKYFNYAFDCNELEKTELLVYLCLLRFCNSSKGWAYPSHERIMKCIGVKDKHTITKAITSLEEKGFIIKINCGIGKNNHYYFVKKFENYEEDYDDL